MFRVRPIASTIGTTARAGVRFHSIAVTGYNDNYITVDLNNRSFQFSTVFLRDACQAPASVDPDSRQKLFTTGAISKGLAVEEKPTVVQKDDGDVLAVTWTQNGTTHQSEYPYEFLDHYSTRDSRLNGKFFGYDRVIWDGRVAEAGFESMNVKYEDYFKDGFKQALDGLKEYGMSFVHDIPDPVPTVGETMTEDNVAQWPVAKLAKQFGYIKTTFYGTLFDVKNVKNAKNIAYTNSFLPLHMDLLYYESPPGLQLLHAIRNSTLGGENIFCDSFLAAKSIRETDPSAYYALTQIPITYHYDNDNEHYYYQRPLIVEHDIMDKRSNYPFIKEVNYSPPFQGPYELGITRDSASSTSALENGNHFLFNDFVRGMGLFEDFVNDPVNQMKIKLEEGTCVVFDNRRVLHSRMEFDDGNGGDRWLMGCYVDGDSFRSKLRL